MKRRGKRRRKRKREKGKGKEKEKKKKDPALNAGHSHCHELAVLGLVRVVVRTPAIQQIVPRFAVPRGRRSQQPRKRAQVRRAVDHVCLDDLTQTGVLALVQGQDDAEEADEAAAGKVAEQVGGRVRRVAFSAQQGQYARHGQVVDVVARHGAVLAVAPEPRHAAHNEPRVQFQQHLFRGQAGFLQHAGPEGVNDHVYRRDDGLDQVYSAR